MIPNEATNPWQYTFMRLIEDTLDQLDATAEILNWQPVRGQNTCGMLFVHIAINQVYWSEMIRSRGNDLGSDLAVLEVLGVASSADGIPLEREGMPPRELIGRESGWYREKLQRAWSHSKTILDSLSERDLQSEIMVKGTPKSISWMLYHLSSHTSQHLGQIRLLSGAVRRLSETRG